MVLEYKDAKDGDIIPINGEIEEERQPRPLPRWA